MAKKSNFWMSLSESAIPFHLYTRKGEAIAKTIIFWVSTVGAYFLADKHLKCNPKPLHKWIRKDILYYQKWLSKK